MKSGHYLIHTILLSILHHLFLLGRCAFPGCPLLFTLIKYAVPGNAYHPGSGQQPGLGSNMRLPVQADPETDK
jgi:hypothetical protein